MRTNDLRSPLTVGLLAAVAAGAIALPPTAGHPGLPGLRVVSDANISLANCAGGADGTDGWGQGFAEWCLNNPEDAENPATLTITGLAYGNTLTVTVDGPANTIVFTGPRGNTFGPFSLAAFYSAEAFLEDAQQFSPGARLEYLQTLRGEFEARVAPAKETLKTVAVVIGAGIAFFVSAGWVFPFVRYVGAALGNPLGQPGTPRYDNLVEAGASLAGAVTAFADSAYVAEASPAAAPDSGAPAVSLDGPSPATTKPVAAGRATRSAAARADAGSGYQYKNVLGNGGQRYAVLSAAALSSPVVQAPSSASAETSHSTSTAKPVTHRSARKAAR